MNAAMAMSPADIEFSDRGPWVWDARHAGPASGPFVADTATALLRTIAEVLDIRRVFPRISEIVRPVVPHEALGLVLCDAAGEVLLEARSREDLPAHGWRPRADDTAHAIVSDLRTASARRTAGDPAVVDALVAAGYRSVLSVRAVARTQVLRLDFVSRRADAYTLADVPAAQHIADYVSLAVAHEQLAAAEERRAEARGRAERVAARVRTLTDKGEALPAHGRMIGRSDAGSTCWRARCAWRRPTPRCFCRANRAPGKKSSPASFTRPRRARTARLWRSTAPRCRSSCSSRSCSATSAGRSPAPIRARPGRSSWRRGACCFSTK